MKLSHYDYLVVGAGISSAVFCHEAAKLGKACLVIDRRDHIAGNIYTEDVQGINVHRYGAHIFHTSLRPVWDYVNRFAEFNNYVNSPVAVYKDELYNLPFNMNTFSKMWGIRTPAEAVEIIERQKAEAADLIGEGEPKNLEEQALSLIGRDVFEKLIKGYTEKQWGRSCTELPPSIIKRLPVRLTYDNNYFNDRWQGIPMGGYTAMVERMFGDVEILLSTEYREFREQNPGIADRTIYCGPIDEYFDFKLGTLEYRSLRFESETVECENWQGNAVVNYTEREVPWTRIIEHKHFEYAVLAGQRDHARVPGRLEARRRAVLPDQRRAQLRAVRAVRGARQAGGRRGVRRPPGRVQVLRHGQGHRRGVRPGECRAGR